MKLFKDPEMLKSLKTEIDVMKQLSGPNVVQMYDFIQT
jgi:hypothetical protein